jgi:hypothetical protein
VAARRRWREEEEEEGKGNGGEATAIRDRRAWRNVARSFTFPVETITFAELGGQLRKIFQADFFFGNAPAGASDTIKKIRRFPSARLLSPPSALMLVWKFFPYNFDY